MSPSAPTISSLCPEADICLNSGRSPLVRLPPHCVSWNVGWNLFNAWRHGDEGVWGENARTIDSYVKVEPCRRQ
jgi:hypothetical protein